MTFEDHQAFYGKAVFNMRFSSLPPKNPPLCQNVEIAAGRLVMGVRVIRR
jgi:hypothetical protein